MNEAPKILIIRRDNIGDLLCTTPLIRVLRKRFPGAYIAALVNSYNAPVLENNPDLDAVHAYTKAKHRPAGESIFSVYWKRLCLFHELRKKHFDYAIIASTQHLDKPLSLARTIKPQHIICFAEADGSAAPGVDIPVMRPHAPALHSVEALAPLAEPFGLHGPMPPMRLVPDDAALAEARQKLHSAKLPSPAKLIGIHISARKVKQRWPTERFVELLRLLHSRYGASFALFWSPGNETNPLHPGDDRKAAEIINQCRDLPLVAFSTHELKDLIAGLATVHQVICSDGGAMHVAAALGKPIVCFFGNSDAATWHPWGVPYVLLQPESRDVVDITTGAAMEAFERLQGRLDDGWRKTGGNGG